MPRFLLRFGQWLLIVAMFFAIGGHWFVLQSVAWGAMMIEYSQKAELPQAVVEVFDGQHPCGLCKQISSGRQSEEQPDAQMLVEKLLLFHEPAVRLVWVQVYAGDLPLVDWNAEMRREQPPIRPPRRNA